MNFMPAIEMTQQEFEETYPQALELLKKYFGELAQEPEVKQLVARAGGRTYRFNKDFFLIDAALIQNHDDNVHTHDFMCALGGGNKDVNMRIGAEIYNSTESVDGKTRYHPYIFIDAISLVDAIRKGKDFRNGQSAEDIIRSALRLEPLIPEVSATASPLSVVHTAAFPRAARATISAGDVSHAEAPGGGATVLRPACWTARARQRIAGVELGDEWMGC